MDEQKHGRTDKASRVILASARTLYRAFTDPEIMANWRSPEGMSAQIEDFRAEVGGGYIMRLRYDAGASAGAGKTAPGEDRVEVRFAELEPQARIVEQVRFLSDDPAYGGVMTLTTLFAPDRDGTRVTFLASDVPHAIDPQDHAEGMAASLRNLARLTE